ncbi:MAG: hypothetical protein GQ579_07555, partial [Bacteroidales bacterium]|nr:hypothetical protein [Bacteroidales bacterium]
SSMDGNPIAEAQSLFLTTTSRSGLTGMVWNENRTSLKEFGAKPAILETVTGTVTLSALKAFERAEVSYLDGSGKVMETKEFESGTELSIPVGEVPAVWYLVKFDRN